MDSLGFSLYKRMHFVDRNSFSSSFPVCKPFVFFFFNCLIILAGTCIFVLNRSGKSRHPCLVLIFKGKLSGFIIKYDARPKFFVNAFIMLTSLVAQMVKHLPTMPETRVQPLGREDLLEKEMATHSRILAWKIPWTEEPGRLQSMGSHESDTTEQLHFHFPLLCWRNSLRLLVC